ncbi:MAG: DHHA1 domain-containing protein, partial [Symbiobacteriaceae bacterium]|nr:DHHA1 domain-containing protein [Symbiobacteriaceae bacterium]
QLVVTVDCGISSVQEALFLRSLGIDLIITDHHQAEATLPQAVAVIDPARPGSAYPLPILAGVGVAFELIRALSLRLVKPAAMRNLTIFTAIGTIADSMELWGVNRLLVSDGLRLLSRGQHPGLAALVKHAGLSGELTATQVAYSVVPKINASGRMQHADLALDLLLCEDGDESAELVAELDQLNELRKRVEQEVFAEALSQYEELGESERQAEIQLLYAPDWHPGVLGIVASRLVERLQRPVLVAAACDEGVKGSGRVPDGYNLHQLLQMASDLLLAFGGHKLAAGFTCQEEQLGALRERLNSCQKELPKTAGELRITLELPVGQDLATIFRSLRLLEPLGNGNEEPVWLLRGAQVRSSRLMGQGEHLNAAIEYGGLTFELVAWRIADQLGGFTGMVDIVARLVRNVYRGQDTIRFELIEWRPVLVDNLEAIRRLRTLEAGASVAYSMTDSYQALLESGYLPPQSYIAPPGYGNDYPALPLTQRAGTDAGEANCWYLDPLFARDSQVTPVTLLVSELQHRSWQRLLEWLLPDLVHLRQIYRWLRQVAEIPREDIPWEQAPFGLSVEDSRQVVYNAIGIFSEAGLCSLNGEGTGSMVIFVEAPGQVRMEEVGRFLLLQQRREELQKWSMAFLRNS